jgi:hypothetical protein
MLIYWLACPTGMLIYWLACPTGMPVSGGGYAGCGFVSISRADAPGFDGSMAMIYLDLDIMNRSKTILGIEK